MGDNERVEEPGYTKAGNVSAMVERNRQEIRNLRDKAAMNGDPDGTITARARGLTLITVTLERWLARNPSAV